MLNPPFGQKITLNGEELTLSGGRLTEKAANITRGAQNAAIGASVGEDKALQVSEVFACVRVITENITALPIKIYKRDAKGIKTRDRAHWLNAATADYAAPNVSGLNFREFMTICMLLKGNAYAKKLPRIGTTNGFNLIPLDPDKVAPFITTEGALIYKYTSAKGVVELQPKEVFHLKGLGGLYSGWSVLQYAAKALGLSIAQAGFADDYYRWGGAPRGIVEAPDVLGPERYKTLNDALKQSLAYEQNFWLLELGLKYTPINVTPADAELIASRQFSAGDICRFFGIPGHLVGHTQQMTSGLSGMEAFNSIFKAALAPYCKRWDDALRLQLLPAADWSRVVVETDMTALMRADAIGRANLYRAALAGGAWLTADEVRQLEGKGPIEGGAVLRQPLNTAPATGQTDLLPSS